MAKKSDPQSLVELKLKVNQKDYTVEVLPDTPLLWVIRDNIGLTGTKYGCGIARCGSCTVHMDGKAVRSCRTHVSDAAGRDPYEFRLSMLKGHPRRRALLELVAEKAGWGTPFAENRGRGLALHKSFNSFVAQVAEVSVSESGSVRVHRVVCAVDCGRVTNPDTLTAQIEGGIVYGLTAALYSAITLKNGRVEQGNFNDYQMLTIREMPEVEVYIMPSEARPTGIGEPGVPPIAPAVANAIFAATGKRIRKLPIRREELKKT